MGASCPPITPVKPWIARQKECGRYVQTKTSPFSSTQGQLIGRLLSLTGNLR